ncbi:ribosomal RNA-processing protein 9 [Clonorchis sinensis]|uniref:Ribosomal RNA-processing protein 9 n=1 Tax=Clonorchis sinensis TaxID=79923 RepID=G7YEM2_CLOSI|nr:ribosomal RNA-processing protein 9 [Clonorchis sinensis]
MDGKHRCVRWTTRVALLEVRKRLCDQQRSTEIQTPRSGFAQKGSGCWLLEGITTPDLQVIRMLQRRAFGGSRKDRESMKSTVKEGSRTESTCTIVRAGLGSYRLTGIASGRMNGVFGSGDVQQRQAFFHHRISFVDYHIFINTDNEGQTDIKATGWRLFNVTLYFQKKKNVTEEIPSDSDEIMSSEDESEHNVTDELESAHEKHIRLTRKAIQKAREQIGSDEEELNAFSLRLREEALLEKGRLLVTLAHKLSPPDPERIIFLLGHKRAVSCVCISDDGKCAFTGGKDSNVMKWNLDTYQRTAVIRGGKRGASYAYHTGPILSIAISSDSKYLATSSMDETVIVWDPEQMTVRTKLKRHRAAVTSVSFRRNSHMLFTADCSGRVCVWNMPLTEVLQDQGARTNIEVLSLCGLSTERCVSCSGFGGPGICVWKVAEEVCVQYTTKNPVETAIECVYAVNDDVFIGGSATNHLYIWHASRGSPVSSISPAHPEPKLLDPSPGQSEFRRPIANWVSAITGLAGTDLIASGSSTGHIQFWRFVRPSDQLETNNNQEKQQQRTQVKLERLTGCSLSLTGFVNSLAFSGDRRFLAVALGQEHRIGKWEPRRPVEAAVCLVPLNLPANFFPSLLSVRHGKPVGKLLGPALDYFSYKTNYSVSAVGHGLNVFGLTVRKRYLSKMKFRNIPLPAFESRFSRYDPF